MNAPPKNHGDVGDRQAVDVAQRERTAMVDTEPAQHHCDPVLVQHGIPGVVMNRLETIEPEAEGMLALMLLTTARRAARQTSDRSMICLDEQDRSRWDLGLIDEGHGLVRACLRRNQPGPVQIPAIAAVHADAPTAANTGWNQIVAGYEHLHALQPNPLRPRRRPMA